MKKEELINFAQEDVEGRTVLMQKEKYGGFRVTVLGVAAPDGSRRIERQLRGIPFWSYAHGFFTQEVSTLREEATR